MTKPQLTKEERAEIRAEAEAMLRLRNEANGLTRIALRMLDDLEAKDAELVVLRKQRDEYAGVYGQKLKAEKERDAALNGIVRLVQKNTDLTIERDDARRERDEARLALQSDERTIQGLMDVRAGQAGRIAELERERDEARAALERMGRDE